MRVSLKNLGAITMFIDDVQRSKSFYQRVFDVKLVHEDDVSVAFDFGNTVVNLLMSSEAHDLIAPGNVAGPESGARVQLTLWVDDADGVCAELGKLGVPLLNGPMDRAWGMRTACFTDPDGHIWEIAQNLNKDRES